MRLLLDTHAFIWWLAGAQSLSTNASAAIRDRGNDIFFSAATVWEIATKHRIGKLPDVAAIVDDLDSAILARGFATLPISVRHGQVASALPGPHTDSFDRMLIAQAMLVNLVFVSNERAFDVYGVRRLW